MTSLLTATLILVTILQLPSPAQQPPPDAIAHAQAVLASIVANEFASVEEQFTGDMKAALPSGRLAATWTTLLNQAGAYKKCETNARVRRIADKQMVITACESVLRESLVVRRDDDHDRIGRLGPPRNPDDAGGHRVIPSRRLVHGSGPNDRDETIGANKPFKDLAAGLASRGIAVLRYDKRTRVHGAKAAALTDFTVKQEVIEDVLEAVKTLRALPGIDSARIFVLGHSLGGMLIPRIGIADPTIAGLIVLAGAARPLEEAITVQTRYLAMADGSISSEEQLGIDRAAALAESVRALQPADASSGRMISGAPASYWLDLRGYDPPSAARSVKAPMLILQGERDYQVTPEEFAKWKAALSSRRDVTFHSYAALNHLFIAGTGPSLPAEYQVPGHVAEDVIRDVATWILATR
jgi:alpha-beta hydrolase superfamily lysophospholipase